MDGCIPAVPVPRSPPRAAPKAAAAARLRPEQQDASGLVSLLGFCFLPPVGACLRWHLSPCVCLASAAGRPQRFWIRKPTEVASPQLNGQQRWPHHLPLTCGLLVPNPRLGVEGTDIECGPMGELMTENGGPMPLMGELRVLMGEWSWPGEPSEEPMPGPMDGWRDGVAMGPRLVGEFRDVELTWLEKSVREQREKRG